MSAVGETIVAIVKPIARLLVDIAEGRIQSPADVTRSLLGIALEFVPDENELRHHLEEVARARQDANFERDKDEKFGPKA